MSPLWIVVVVVGVTAAVLAASFFLAWCFDDTGEDW